MAMPPSTMKMPRQFKIVISTPPNTGAPIGARPLTSISRAKNRVNSWPLYISRAIARDSTAPPAPANPSNSRASSSWLISCASAQPIEAINSNTSDRVSGRRRPNLSLIGPKSSWPKPRPSRPAVRLSCAVAVSVCRSCAICGSAGR